MKIAFSIIVVLFVCSTALAVKYWRLAEKLRFDNVTLATENKAWRDEGGRLEKIKAGQQESELAKLRVEAQEVHKLRNEVSQLRTTAQEVEKLRGDVQTLREDNRRLRVSAATASTNAPAAAPTELTAKPGDQFPREQWSFSGYQTPESALVSAIWAMREGNPTVYLESLAPDEQLRVAKSWESKTEAEIAQKHQQDVASIKSMRILERAATSDNEMVMNIYVEGVNRVERVAMKKIGNEWKFGGFIRDAPPALPLPK